MSKSQERRVVGYLRPAHMEFIKGYVEVNGISESKAIAEAVAALKKCQPPEQLAKIVNKNKY